VGFRVSLLSSPSGSNYLTQPYAHGIADTTFGHRAILDIGTGARDPGVSFDTTYSQATVTLKMKETHLAPPTILSYQTYEEQRMRWDVQRSWRELTDKSYKASSTTGGGEGIAIDLPYRIKSKTFRRLFGGDNVGVRVQGNISINGSLRRQKFDEIQAVNQQNTNTAFRIDMVQQFTITGKVGQKVEVKVDQDSERMFDFENSLKLTYTGDEDEIIQKIEAGNVALNLGTKLATFSGKNTGLFGLKTQLKAGPLSLTGIASLERGQKNKLSSGNSASTRREIHEKEILHDQYFMVTNTSIAGSRGAVPNFLEYYRHYYNMDHIAAPPNEQLYDIQVWAQVTQGQSVNGARDGRAAAIQYIQDLSLPDSATYPSDNNHWYTKWRVLSKGVDYDVDLQLGRVRLRSALPAGLALGCAFRLVGGNGIDTTSFGTLYTGNGEGLIKLVLLRPANPLPDDSTWTLMLRNIYPLGASSIDRNNFKLEIIRKAAAGRTEETGPQVPGFTGQTWLTFFDFDRQGPGGSQTPDGQVDAFPALINYEFGELHFLDLTPFKPSGFYKATTANPLGGDLVVWPLDTMETALQDTSHTFTAPYLYKGLLSSAGQYADKWTFRAEYKGSSSVYSLGVLVLENSEEVMLNGQKLTRGIDYTVDYSSGELRILNDAAKAPGANLDITYESGQTSSLDKTTLLGARAEYALWQDSYIGGMLLYLNQSTLDKRVRIGMEPIRNTLWDANTSLKFKPEFLTRAIDALPLIRTDAPSDMTIDAEIARVVPNPNSLSNSRTGDFNGLAYVDDFEGSRRATPLGMSRRTWSISSIPTNPSPNGVPVREIDHRRGRLRWYNPNTRDQVPVKEVFPDREVNSQVANTLQSLIFEFTPDTIGGPADSSWGGVMRYLGEGYADETRAQYLEFWINMPNNLNAERDPDARLVVDLGQLSEDALPNDTLDTEDRPLPGVVQTNPRSSSGNGVLTPEEDAGLDGKFGTDPQDSAYWNGHDHPPVPSWDDWQYSANSSDFSHINGTERNRNDEGGGYPDTEDLNNNQTLDTQDNYFSYTFKLTDPEFLNKYTVGRNPRNRWRLLRIPISPDKQHEEVRTAHGNPRLDNVRWARIYVTGIHETATPTRIETVQMDIVSNEWLPATSLSNDSTEYVSTAVINTHENPGYVSPPGVEGEIDPITNLRQREQSLVLKVNELKRLSGPDSTNRIPSEFFVSKNLYQPMNMTEYKRLKMFVHGGDTLGASNFEDNKLELILRFGRTYGDMNNFYDIVETVHPGWHSQNVIDIAMNELSNLNSLRAAAVAAQDTNHRALTINGRFAAERTTTPWRGDSLVISGNPTMSQVGFIALGVRILNKNTTEHVENKEIWVDELRVSDIYKDPGTAMDVSTSLNLADFVQLSGGYRNTDADFHNVNTRVGANASTDALSGNATVNLQKVWLDRFGYQLPLHLSYNETNQSPRIIPGTDTRIIPSTAPDSIKTKSKSFSYGLRFSKGGNSKVKLINWTLEKFTAQWDYTLDKRSDPANARNNSEQSAAQVAYSFPTSKGRGVPPLWWAKRLPLLAKVADMRFYFKPTKLTVNAQASKVVQNQFTRAGVTTGSRQFLTTRSLNTGLAPFDPITIDYTRSHKGQLLTGDWAKLVAWNWGQTTDVTQNLTNTYSPEFLPWFKPTVNYTTTYAWANRNFSQTNAQSVSNQRNFGTDVQLDFRNIFGESGGSGGRGRRGRDRDRERGSDRPEEPDRGRGPGNPRDMMQGDSLGSPRDGMPPRGLPMPGDSLRGGPSHRGPLGSTAAGDTTRARSDTSRARSDTTKSHREGGSSPLQLLGQVFRPIKKALTFIDPIALSYDNTAGHSQSATIGQASLPYQFGFTQNPGLRVDSGYGSIPTLRSDEKITARSGLRLTQDIRVAFNYSHDASENSSQSRLGSVEQTTFWLGTKKTTAFPFMDVSVDWSGLERIKFLSSVTKTISLSSALSNKMREGWANSRSNVQSREYTRNWNPLLRANVSWKGDIDSQIGFTSSSTYSNQLLQSTRSRSTDNRLTASVSYTIHTGFKLPLLIMRSVRLQNQTTFSLNVDYGKQTQDATQTGSDDYAPRAATSSWSVQPRMTYSFSNTVQGQGYVQFQQTKNDINQSKSRVFEFGIQVNIAIRG
jgi:cell surface protein SprA